MASIVSGVNFDVTKDFMYTKAKVNANGRKSIGILNNENKKSLYVSTPLMLTWGVNTYNDEKTGEVQSYDIALQFPNDEYNNPDCVAFLKNMQALEQKIKEDAVLNSKDWLNKNKLVPDAVDALWSPMLKYPKDKETGEPDYSRAPTLKVKIPYWEGEFKNVELYNDSKELVFPKDEESNISEFIVKGSNVATIIQCGGIWFGGKGWGVTWRLNQAVVHRKKRYDFNNDVCIINLSSDDKQRLENPPQSDVQSSEVEEETEPVDDTKVEDSDEDKEEPTPPPAPKKVVKKVVKKKVASAE